MSEKQLQILLEMARGSGPVGEKLAVAIEAQMAGGQKQQIQNSQSDSEVAFGEFRAYARKTDGSAPVGLADAIASTAAACKANGGGCEYRDGSTYTAHWDKQAWNNIKNAVGGTDLSGGGNLMCVKDQLCLLVHSARIRTPSGSKMVKRAAPLTPSGTVTIIGSARGDITLYYYNMPFQGWMTKKDWRGP